MFFGSPVYGSNLYPATPVRCTCGDPHCSGQPAWRRRSPKAQHPQQQQQQWPFGHVPPQAQRRRRQQQPQSQPRSWPQPQQQQQQPQAFPWPFGDGEFVPEQESPRLQRQRQQQQQQEQQEQLRQLTQQRQARLRQQQEQERQRLAAVKQALRMHRAASTIQKAWRATVARRRETAAATTLQRSLRRMVAVRQAKRVTASLAALQRLTTRARELRAGMQPCNVKSVRATQHFLESLCLEVDNVATHGSLFVRHMRKQTVNLIQRLLDEVDAVMTRQAKAAATIQHAFRAFRLGKAAQSERQSAGEGGSESESESESAATASLATEDEEVKEEVNEDEGKESETDTEVVSGSQTATTPASDNESDDEFDLCWLWEEDNHEDDDVQTEDDTAAQDAEEETFEFVHVAAGDCDGDADDASDASDDDAACTPQTDVIRRQLETATANFTRQLQELRASVQDLGVQKTDEKKKAIEEAIASLLAAVDAQRC